MHAWAFEQRERLRPLFTNRRYFETLRLEPYYLYAAHQTPQAAAPRAPEKAHA